jgi:hypothetical protein
MHGSFRCVLLAGAHFWPMRISGRVGGAPSARIVSHFDANDFTFAHRVAPARYGFEGGDVVMLLDKRIEQTRTGRMDDTDRLVAAIFAATMTARLQIAKVDDFLGHYDACLEVMRRRQAAGGGAAADRTLDTFWQRSR